MFKSLVNFSNPGVLKLVFAFILGAILTYFIQDYVKLKTSYSIQTRHSSSSSVANPNKRTRSFEDMHEKMMKKMDRMFDSSFFGSSLLDDSFFDKGAFQSFTQEVQIKESEDGRFKYIKVLAEGLDKEAMKVNVADGMISISGRIIKENEDQSTNGFTSSSYSSTFSKSFSVPFGVDANKVEIENDEDGVVLKFPKKTI